MGLALGLAWPALRGWLPPRRRRGSVERVSSVRPAAVSVAVFSLAVLALLLVTVKLSAGDGDTLKVERYAWQPPPGWSDTTEAPSAYVGTKGALTLQLFADYATEDWPVELRLGRDLWPASQRGREHGTSLAGETRAITFTVTNVLGHQRTVVV